MLYLGASAVCCVMFAWAVKAGHGPTSLLLFVGLVIAIYALLDWRDLTDYLVYILAGLAAISLPLMLLSMMVTELHSPDGSFGLALSLGLTLTVVALVFGVVGYRYLAYRKAARATSSNPPSPRIKRSAVPTDERIQSTTLEFTTGTRRVLDQLTGAEPVPPASNDLLSASLMEILGVAGGAVVRTPAAYLGVPAGTPRGVERPAVIWNDAVLTVDDGKDVVVYGEPLIWHLAQLCERCGTLLLARFVRDGLIFIDDSDELLAALDGSYRPFTPGCSNCRVPAILIPKYEKQRDCESRSWRRRKNAHNFTQGSPGLWNSGDIVWCLDCGKQAVAITYLSTFLLPPSGV